MLYRDGVAESSPVRPTIGRPPTMPERPKSSTVPKTHTAFGATESRSLV